MRHFTDNEGRQWSFRLDVSVIRRVRTMASCNLLAIFDKADDVLGRLGMDPILLADVLYAICKPEADARNVTDEDFGRALYGQAIADATDALLEALADFFEPRRARLLRAILTKMQKVRNTAQEMIEAKLESGAIEAEIQQALQSASEPSGKPPGSSASTPAPSAGAS
jgi:hypothetical protein